MESIEITSKDDLIIYLFAILITPEVVGEDSVTYNKEAILEAMKGVDEYMSLDYGTIEFVLQEGENNGI